MKEIFESYAKNGRFHHVYCIESSLENRAGQIAELHAFLKGELDFAVQGNPDFSNGLYETFGIDEARALKEAQLKKALGDGNSGKKIFVVQAQSFTSEAQNSLLKVFEEPTEGTHFFIFIPSTEALLPTLRSRLVIVSDKSGQSGQVEQRTIKTDSAILVFLSASKPQRLELIKKMAEEKDRSAAIDFLNKLEIALYKKFRLSKDSPQNAFRELYKMKDYLGDRSSSVKMILEHIALVLPSF